MRTSHGYQPPVFTSITQQRHPGNAVPSHLTFGSEIQPMRQLVLTAVSCCLIGCASTLGTRTFVGPGPDPACGGTELSVTENRGQVVAIQQTIYASTRTIVERYTPLRNGNWQTSLMLYSSRWQNNDPLTPDCLIRKTIFRTDNAQTEEAVLRDVFGYTAMDWEKEPKRFLDYYHANRADFKQEAEVVAPNGP